MIKIELDGYDELIKTLDRIDDTLTNRTMREMVQAAAEIVRQRARQLVPVGDPQHNPGAKSLRDTIGVVVRNYGERSLALVGPEYPAGAHGHLVEYGHRKVLWGKRTGDKIDGKPFVRPAFDETKAAQMSAMEVVIARALRELGA